MPFDASPLCPPLEPSRVVAPPDAFVAPAVIDEPRAHAVVEAAIRVSFARPADIASARLDALRLVHVPFWRVEGSVDGFHLGISSGTRGNGRPFFMPTGGARHRDGEMMLCARTLFPWAPEPSVYMFGKPLIQVGASPIEIALTELTPASQARITDGERVEADMPREEAERRVAQLLMRAVAPGNAIFANYQPSIRRVAFCHYPLFIQRYEYAGDVKTDPGDVFFVVVSGRTGEIVNERHPSKLRSVAGKVKKLLSSF